MKIRDLTFIPLATALICILAPISIPIGPIPLSLSTFAVYITGGILEEKRGTMAVLLYILLGAIGLPVFSGFSGGMQKLFGVTGGYIIGYLPCVYISGYIIRRCRDKKSLYPVALLLGTLACYALGTLWFIIETKVSLQVALATCLLPFIPGDIIKIIAAAAVIYPVRKITKVSFT